MTLAIQFDDEASQTFRDILLNRLSGYTGKINGEYTGSSAPAAFDGQIVGLCDADDAWVNEFEVQPVDDEGEPSGVTVDVRVETFYVY